MFRRHFVTNFVKSFQQLTSLRKQTVNFRRMSTTTIPSKIRLGLCQLRVGMNKSENLLNASKAIANATEQGANIVVLPVM